MQPEESRYSEDWFRIGAKELARARYLLAGSDLDGAGYNIQQAVEKYLKGYLIGKGWELRRIHNLETLINEAIRYDPSYEEFRAACQKITRYYIRDRYPLMFTSELTEDDIKESLTVAEKIIAKVQGLV